MQNSPRGFSGWIFWPPGKKYYSSNALGNAFPKRCFVILTEHLYISTKQLPEEAWHFHTAMLNVAVDAASCVARLTEHQRKFRGQHFFISLNITVIFCILSRKCFLLNKNISCVCVFKLLVFKAKRTKVKT